MKLPDQFPDRLPEVFVAELTELPQVAAHVEKSGKVCVARASNLLLDGTRPRALVRDVLTAARGVLEAALGGEAGEDLAREFLAYWEQKDRVLWSIVDADGPARRLEGVELEGSHLTAKGVTLLAESVELARQWANRASFASKLRRTAFLLPLTHAPPLPGRDGMTQGEWLGKVKLCTAPADWAAFEGWLVGVSLPCPLLFTLPAPRSPVKTLAALNLAGAVGDLRKQAIKGFRSNTVPASHELRFARRQPLEPLKLIRFDLEFLMARGGGEMEPRESSLASKRVLLAGCGSVGSFLAKGLAMLGVGEVVLVDPDFLQAHNVQRHLLGVEFVGQRKATALAAFLGRQHPSQIFTPEVTCVESLLEDPEADDPEYDLVVFALGEPTLERRLEALLHGTAPRVHAWLEPLGVGGHVLASGAGEAPGCFECLFRQDPEYGVLNGADLAAPGQEFDQSLAGCGGTYSPFSGIDAIRTALEATTICGRVLQQQAPRSLLLSWRGEGGMFEARYKLSSRGERMKPGARDEVTDFARADCAVCRGAM